MQINEPLQYDVPTQRREMSKIRKNPTKTLPKKFYSLNKREFKMV